MSPTSSGDNNLLLVLDDGPFFYGYSDLSAHGPYSEVIELGDEDQEDEPWDIVGDRMLASYAAGETCLEDLVHQCHQVLELCGIPVDRKRAILGEIAHLALRTSPPRRPAEGPKRPKGRPPGTRKPAWLRRDAAAVVRELAAQGYPKARGPESAYELAAEILVSVGIAVTARQVEDAYFEERRLDQTNI